MILKKNTREIVKEILDFLNIFSDLPKEINIIYNQYSHTRGEISQSILKNTSITKISRKLIPEHIRIRIREQLLTQKAKKPVMLDEDKNFLEQFYRKEIEKLQDILNKELPWGKTNLK